jgi:large subunit ribosomal protein L24
MQKIRKGDTVVVLAGKDKGKEGEVLRSLPKENRVVVRGINVVKKHTKATQTSQGGILAVEAPIAVSNVSHIDPTDKKPTRVGFKVLEDGSKVRFSKRSGEVLDK